MTFTVTVQPSGRTFSTDANEALLVSAIRQGIGLPYGCKDGACGSCKCRRLSGQVQQGPHQAKALTEAEAAQGYILTCCAVAHSDVVLESRQVTEANAYPVRKMPVRVSQLERLSTDVMKIVLQLPANDPFRFHAGQYVEFLLRDGSRRSYSMATAPHLLSSSPTLELHVRHMPGGLFTDQVFGSMKVKDILRIEGPFGSFQLREHSERPIVLLASGTGFAPIKALIQALQHQGSTRPATLYWGGRRPSDLYAHDWVKEQLSVSPWLSYVPVVSDAWPEDGWTGREGWVHRAVLADHANLSSHEVYACGAPVMVEAARHDFVNAGLDPDHFYADAFTSALDQLDRTSR